MKKKVKATPEAIAKAARLRANSKQTGKEFLLIFEDLVYIVHLGDVRGEPWWCDRDGRAIECVRTGALPPPYLPDVISLVASAYELCAPFGAIEPISEEAEEKVVKH